MSIFENAPWQWRWTEMCGAAGLEIISPDHYDLGICFQQLVFQIPALALLAITSAYYSYSLSSSTVQTDWHSQAINCRLFVVFFLAISPVIQTYIDVSKSPVPVATINFFLSAVQALTWIVHFCYLSVLKKLDISYRGHGKICALWGLFAALSVFNLYSHCLVMYGSKSAPDFSARVNFAFAIVAVVLHLLYAATLLPSSSTPGYVRYVEVRVTERSPLLGNYDVFRYREEEDILGVAMENASWLSCLLFYWVNPLIRKGAENKLNHHDELFDLPYSLACRTMSFELSGALSGDAETESLSSGGSTSSSQSSVESLPEIGFRGEPDVSLLRALHRCFWVHFYSVGLLKFVADCAGFAGPLLLNKLVGFIENQGEDIEYGYKYAAGLFGASMIGALFNTQFSFLMSTVGLKIRAAIVSTIYRKTLTVGGTELNSAFSVGEIVNFMSTDADRIVNSCPSFHALWSIPFQLAITLYLLYAQVGLAFLAGVAFTVLLIPINKFIASKIGELSTKMMAKKDERVKVMTETLRGIRTIKLHAWESHFISLITKHRAGELRYLKGRKYLDALCVYFWATTPVLISILTFGTFVLLGNKLTAATVFTTMALLNMLIGPLNAFPWVLNGVTEAWVSIKRVQRFLDLPDLDKDAFYDSEVPLEDAATHIKITDANFTWGKTLNPVGTSSVRSRRKRDKGKRKKSARHEGDGEASARTVEEGDNRETREFSLRGISLNVARGQFIGVIGHVGSGKSSLLAAVSAEIAKQGGSIAVAELEMGFGFVSQVPWLQRGTLRNNILFGKAYDGERYCSVLYACGLAEDVLALPDGDQTGIGEGGATLSGGQKARVALARAVYQDKPIYLLDDVLSAVDQKVAKHIYQHCIMNFLAAKTRILCTHHTQYLVNADYVIAMDDGHISQQGKPSEVLPDFEDYFLPSDVETCVAGKSADSQLLDSLSTDVAAANCEAEESGSVLNEEGRETGSVSGDVYCAYWSNVGPLLGACILASMLLMQTSRNMTDWWLSYWVSHSPASNATNSTVHNVSSASVLYLPNSSSSGNLGFYMTVYGLFVGSNTVFTLFRAFLFAYAGVAAATRFHSTLLRSVMMAKLTFFDVSPLGRVLNRFSSDTYTIDDSLPFILNILFAQIFGTIGAVVITVYGLPWLCLVLVPLVPVYHWLQSSYRRTSRELKRLSSVTLSPVYGHFTETLQGLATVRALRAAPRFVRDNEHHVEANLKAQFASAAVAQWLGLRLQFIGVAMISGVGVIAVVQHQYDVVDPGLVGLAISYALSITSLLSGVVNAFTEVEREMVAVERVRQYVRKVRVERDPVVIDPPYGWPFQGVVTFDRVVMKYREHLPPSLRGVSFETRPAEKVGVVGRTGAGKTSLLSSLFRLVDLESGSIIVDTVNIAHIPLDALRTRLSIIPQDPFLFSGTVRENLDPLGEYRDRDLWSALTRVDMTPVIRRLGGLDSLLGTSGCNLSSGQRQLICLARAVLQNAKILCIDEATANVDKETDRQIQQTIRSAFRQSTVITIAHRVQTILDYDRVLVMGDGQVLEFACPDDLLSDPDSHFYQLVNQES